MACSVMMANGSYWHALGIKKWWTKQAVAEIHCRRGKKRNQNPSIIFQRKEANTSPDILPSCMPKNIFEMLNYCYNLGSMKIAKAASWKCYR